MTRFANRILNIETKEDTAEKLAYAQGKPTKNFMFADELNAIVDAINILRGMIAVSPVLIDGLIASGTELNIGEIAPADVVTFINSHAPGYSLGVNTTTFVTFTSDGVNYVWVFAGEPGIYGSGLLSVSETDFIPIVDGENPIGAGSQKWAARVNLNFGDDQPTILTQDDSLPIILTKSPGEVGKYVATCPNINAGDAPPVIVVGSSRFTFAFEWTFLNLNQIEFQCRNTLTGAFEEAGSHSFQFLIEKYN